MFPACPTRPAESASRALGVLPIGPIQGSMRGCLRANARASLAPPSPHEMQAMVRQIPSAAIFLYGDRGGGLGEELPKLA